MDWTKLENRTKIAEYMARAGCMPEVLAAGCQFKTIVERESGLFVPHSVFKHIIDGWLTVYYIMVDDEMYETNLRIKNGAIWGAPAVPCSGPKNPREYALMPGFYVGHEVWSKIGHVDDRYNIVYHQGGVYVRRPMA